MLPDQDDDAYQKLATAINKVNAGAYKDALAICNDLTRLADPQLVTKAHLVAGRAYRLLSQLEAAERELQLGLQWDASQAQGYVDLGMIRIQQRRYNEAIHYLVKARECSHTDAHVQLTLAVAWLQAQQFEEAYSELERLLSSRDHGISHSGLQVLRIIAWYGKTCVLYRLLLAGLTVVTLIVPFTRVVSWVLLTLLTMGALLVLWRSKLLWAGAPALVFNYLVVTGVFLALLTAF